MQPRGVRNNNFGNIEASSWAQAQPGYVGSDGRFAQFATPDDGVNAIGALLKNKYNRGLTTPRQILGDPAHGWAPASDGNDVSAYANYIAKRAGVGPDDQLDPSHIPSIARGIAEYENGPGALTGLSSPRSTPNPGGPSVPNQPALSADSLYGPGVLQALQDEGRWDGPGGVGGTMQNIGAWLMAANDPKGSSALLGAAQAPLQRRAQLMAQLLTKERYTPVQTTDSLGNQTLSVLNRSDGSVQQVPLGGTGSPSTGSPTGPNGQPNDNMSPLARKTRVEADTKTYSDMFEATQKAEQEALKGKALGQELRDTLNNPHVTTGAGAPGWAHLKSVAQNWDPTGLLAGTVGVGAGQMSLIDKKFQDLVSHNMAAMNGIRVAGPEIKFAQAAEGGLDKPKDTNLQILSDHDKNYDAAIGLAQLARDYKAKHGSLDAGFHQLASEWAKSQPFYKLDVLKKEEAPQPPTTAPAATGVSGASASPSGYKVIKVH